MPASRADIDSFLACRRIAFAGVSRDAKDFSRALFRDLAARGYDLVPVHPVASEIEDRRAYLRIIAVDPKPEAVLVLTTAASSEAVVRDAAEAGVPLIWLYGGAGRPGAVSEAALTAAREAGMRVIAGECPYMFLKNSGWFHSVHRGLRWITGTLPR
jgi:predicted CoA-binding protein